MVSGGISPTVTAIMRQMSEATALTIQTSTGTTASSTVTTTETTTNYGRAITIHNVATTISTRLLGSTTFNWWIDSGSIQIDFNNNSLWGVLWRNGSTALAEEMVNVARSINPDYLAGRTVGGMRVDIQLHWAAFAVTDVAEFLAIGGRDYIARIGGTIEDMPGFDGNAWFFESTHAASIVARINLLNPMGTISAIRDIERYLSFSRN